MDVELDGFSRLNFIALAAELGFVRDERESGGRSHVLRSAGGDKLAVKERTDGTWCYFNVHDHADRGCIVDLVQRRLGLSLGHARKHLRESAGIANTPFPRPVFTAFTATSPKVDPDHAYKKSLAVWNAVTWMAEPAYLLERGLAPATLSDPRFADCWRVDRHGNVIFPHHDRRGLCGYERRGTDCKAFGKDTRRGLWHSRNLKEASRITVCEAPIDALSHAQMKGGDSAYVAISGALGAVQRDLLTGLFAKANQRQAVVVIATDNDDAGHSYREQLQLLAPMALERETPILKDWNADLLAAPASGSVRLCATCKHCYPTIEGGRCDLQSKAVAVNTESCGEWVGRWTGLEGAGV